MELDEREQRGEYVAPAVRLCIAEGPGDPPAMRHWAQACVEDGSPLLTMQVCMPGGWGRGAHDPPGRRILNGLAASQGANVSQLQPQVERRVNRRLFLHHP